MMWDPDVFFTLHRDLPREGPGLPADVYWAAQKAGLAKTAEIADVGCGPGADIAAWLEVAPDGHVTALDKVAHFVEAARANYRADPRVTILKADMTRIINSYDMIWCAGAVYFLGVTEALTRWRPALRPGGAIAFTEPCWFGTPSPRAKALFGEYEAMTDLEGITTRIEDAGFEMVATRPLDDAAWEAYLGPIDVRIAALRPTADAVLNAVLDEAVEEAACWRAHRREFGYQLCVVRPK